MPPSEPWTPLLRAVVGSHAHNLATPNSDIDHMEIAVAPMNAFLGLRRPPTDRTGTRVGFAPDSVTHEVGKFLTLGLQCNPTILDLLWLDKSAYTLRHPLGEELIRARHKLLSAERVRSAFLGYATAQFDKLAKRGDGTFSSDTRNRSLKHARHLWRLIRQGTELWLTGTMTPRLDDEDRDRCFAFAENTLDDPAVGRRRIEKAAEVMRVSSPSLPAAADRDWFEDWLRTTRRALDTP